MLYHLYLGYYRRPKGVMVEPQNVVRLFFNDQVFFLILVRRMSGRCSIAPVSTSVSGRSMEPCYLAQAGHYSENTATDTRAYLEVLQQEGVTATEPDARSLLQPHLTGACRPEADLRIRRVIFGEKR